MLKLCKQRWVVANHCAKLMKIKTTLYFHEEMQLGFSEPEIMPDGLKYSGNFFWGQTSFSLFLGKWMMGSPCQRLLSA